MKNSAKFTTVREDANYISVYADAVKIGGVYGDSECGYYIAEYCFRRNLRRQAPAEHPLRAGFSWLKETYRRNNG